IWFPDCRVATALTIAAGSEGPFWLRAPRASPRKSTRVFSSIELPARRKSGSWAAALPKNGSKDPPLQLESGDKDPPLQLNFASAGHSCPTNGKSYMPSLRRRESLAARLRERSFSHTPESPRTLCCTTSERGARRCERRDSGRTRGTRG